MSRIAFACCVAALALAPAPLFAQTVKNTTPEQRQAAVAAHRGDFDYLLGDWEFTAQNHDYGKIRGYWSATRLATGQIMDEYRVSGDAGETYYVATTIRAYNAALDRWELVGMEEGNGLQDLGTAQRVGNEIHLEQRFGVAAGRPALWRIKYSNIRPDAFTWSADRSTDEGKTWITPFQQLEARRIGPARSLEPLAPARNATKK